MTENLISGSITLGINVDFSGILQALFSPHPSVCPLFHLPINVDFYKQEVRRTRKLLVDFIAWP